MRLFWGTAAIIFVASLTDLLARNVAKKSDDQNVRLLAFAVGIATEAFLFYFCIIVGVMHAFGR